MKKNLIFDCHTHLNDETYEEQNIPIEEIIEEANNAGVGYLLNCAFSVASSEKAIEQAHKFENIFVAVGIHPNEVQNHKISDLKKLKILTQDSSVVAIGEVGLDYFYQKEDAEIQKQWFKDQIEIAQERDLTLMMHIRDAKGIYEAYDDVLEILEEFKPNRMIVHCFSANLEYAKKFIDLGCWINIGGAVTFKNAKELQEATAWIPLEKILVETDAPYLTPHPFRGQMNFPKNIILTVEKIAELKNLSKDEIISATTENAFKAFNIFS
ncbi:Mg-dependent DNase [Williamsoniiplasma somnilux]|uniref:Mg-dependent DNase n=1 Tax=Williamsoniiplasma somnilux TaxID=215578 RepID=A0A2K8P0K0_9MOLU|nr:TatD family hydrolase [Williamsoniiplasma somnilux]ATZ18423.1 Mg-dependent DNase [Williamsoniiplasma somnilux]